MKTRQFISFGMLLTLAFGLGVTTYYGRHSLAPGPPAVRVTKPVQPQGNQPSANNVDTDHSSRADNSVSVGAPGAASQPKAGVVSAAAKDSTIKQHRNSTVTANNREYPRREYQALAIPNDTYAANWWSSQAKLNQSWDVPAGSTPTVLAIIDSGFALDHEEFAGRWHKNTAEIGATSTEAASALNCTDRSLPVTASCNQIDDDANGIVDDETGSAVYENPSRLNCTDAGLPLSKSCNRIDDDINGRIDDATGWDFANNDNAPQAGEINPAGAGIAHGTMVAGLAAATGNNAKGIAGVDWTAKILPIQAMNDDAYGDTWSVGQSIYYAIDQGADVISLSLGTEMPDDYVRGAVRAALVRGIVVVAASGNDGCECMVYPAQYPEVVAVGAINSSNQVADFSSYGASVDIVAPGVNMQSATWQAANGTSAYAGGLNGTSFATPLVAGTISRLKSIIPAATPAQLIAAVTENVNRLSLSSPHDDHFGFGTLDVAKAVNRMAVPSAVEIPHGLTPVSQGGVLQPSDPFEPASAKPVHVCQGGAVPSTAVYDLTKGDSNFFSISKVENQQAVAAGYSSQFFAYACLQQPHDNNSVIHMLDIFHEFRNVYPKI